MSYGSWKIASFIFLLIIYTTKQGVIPEYESTETDLPIFQSSEDLEIVLPRDCVEMCDDAGCIILCPEPARIEKRCTPESNLNSRICCTSDASLSPIINLPPQNDAQQSASENRLEIVRRRRLPKLPTLSNNVKERKSLKAPEPDQESKLSELRRRLDKLKSLRQSLFQRKLLNRRKNIKSDLSKTLAGNDSPLMISLTKPFNKPSNIGSVLADEEQNSFINTNCKPKMEVVLPIYFLDNPEKENLSETNKFNHEYFSSNTPNADSSSSSLSEIEHDLATDDPPIPLHSGRTLSVSLECPSTLEKQNDRLSETSLTSVTQSELNVNRKSYISSSNIVEHIPNTFDNQPGSDGMPQGHIDAIPLAPNDVLLSSGINHSSVSTENSPIDLLSSSSTPNIRDHIILHAPPVELEGEDELPYQHKPDKIERSPNVVYRNLFLQTAHSKMYEHSSVTTNQNQSTSIHSSLKDPVLHQLALNHTHPREFNTEQLLPLKSQVSYQNQESTLNNWKGDASSSTPTKAVNAGQSLALNPHEYYLNGNPVANKKELFSVLQHEPILNENSPTDQDNESRLAESVENFSQLRSYDTTQTQTISTEPKESLLSKEKYDPSLALLSPLPRQKQLSPTDEFPVIPISEHILIVKQRDPRLNSDFLASISNADQNNESLIPEGRESLSPMGGYDTTQYETPSKESLLSKEKYDPSLALLTPLPRQKQLSPTDEFPVIPISEHLLIVKQRDPRLNSDFLASISNADQNNESLIPEGRESLSPMGGYDTTQYETPSKESLLSKEKYDPSLALLTPLPRQKQLSPTDEFPVIPISEHLLIVKQRDPRLNSDFLASISNADQNNESLIPEGRESLSPMGGYDTTQYETPSKESLLSEEKYDPSLALLTPLPRQKQLSPTDEFPVNSISEDLSSVKQHDSRLNSDSLASISNADQNNESLIPEGRESLSPMGGYDTTRYETPSKESLLSEEKYDPSLALLTPLPRQKQLSPTDEFPVNSISEDLSSVKQHDSRLNSDSLASISNADQNNESLIPEGRESLSPMGGNDTTQYETPSKESLLSEEKYDPSLALLTPLPRQKQLSPTDEFPVNSISEDLSSVKQHDSRLNSDSLASISNADQNNESLIPGRESLSPMGGYDTTRYETPSKESLLSEEKYDPSLALLTPLPRQKQLSPTDEFPVNSISEDLSSVKQRDSRLNSDSLASISNADQNNESLIREGRERLSPLGGYDTTQHETPSRESLLSEKKYDPPLAFHSPLPRQYEFLPTDKFPVNAISEDLLSVKQHSPSLISDSPASISSADSPQGKIPNHSLFVHSADNSRELVKAEQRGANSVDHSSPALEGTAPLVEKYPTFLELIKQRGSWELEHESVESSDSSPYSNVDMSSNQGVLEVSTTTTERMFLEESLYENNEKQSNTLHDESSHDVLVSKYSNQFDKNEAEANELTFGRNIGIPLNEINSTPPNVKKELIPLVFENSFHPSNPVDTPVQVIYDKQDTNENVFSEEKYQMASKRAVPTGKHKINGGPQTEEIRPENENSMSPHTTSTKREKFTYLPNKNIDYNNENINNSSKETETYATGRVGYLNIIQAPTVQDGQLKSGSNSGVALNNYKIFQFEDDTINPSEVLTPLSQVLSSDVNRELVSKEINLKDNIDEISDKNQTKITEAANEFDKHKNMPIRTNFVTKNISYGHDTVGEKVFLGKPQNGDEIFIKRSSVTKSENSPRTDAIAGHLYENTLAYQKDNINQNFELANSNSPTLGSTNRHSYENLLASLVPYRADYTRGSPSLSDENSPRPEAIDRHFYDNILASLASYQADNVEENLDDQINGNSPMSLADEKHSYENTQTALNIYQEANYNGNLNQPNDVLHLSATSPQGDNSLYETHDNVVENFDLTNKNLPNQVTNDQQSYENLLASLVPYRADYDEGSSNLSDDDLRRSQPIDKNSYGNILASLASYQKDNDEGKLHQTNKNSPTPLAFENSPYEDTQAPLNPYKGDNKKGDFDKTNENSRLPVAIDNYPYETIQAPLNSYQETNYNENIDQKNNNSRAAVKLITSYQADNNKHSLYKTHEASSMLEKTSGVSNKNTLSSPVIYQSENIKGNLYSTNENSPISGDITKNSYENMLTSLDSYKEENYKSKLDPTNESSFRPVTIDKHSYENLLASLVPYGEDYTRVSLNLSNGNSPRPEAIDRQSYDNILASLASYQGDNDEGSSDQTNKNSPTPVAIDNSRFEITHAPFNTYQEDKKGDFYQKNVSSLLPVTSFPAYQSDNSKRHLYDTHENSPMSYATGGLLYGNILPSPVSYLAENYKGLIDHKNKNLPIPDTNNENPYESKLASIATHQMDSNGQSPELRYEEFPGLSMIQNHSYENLLASLVPYNADWHLNGNGSFHQSNENSPRPEIIDRQPYENILPSLASYEENNKRGLDQAAGNLKTFSPVFSYESETGDLGETSALNQIGSSANNPLTTNKNHFSPGNTDRLTTHEFTTGQMAAKLPFSEGNKMDAESDGIIDESTTGPNWVALDRSSNSGEFPNPTTYEVIKNKAGAINFGETVLPYSADYETPTLITDRVFRESLTDSEGENFDQEDKLSELNSGNVPETGVKIELYGTDQDSHDSKYSHQLYLNISNNENNQPGEITISNISRQSNSRGNSEADDSRLENTGSIVQALRNRNALGYGISESTPEYFVIRDSTETQDSVFPQNEKYEDTRSLISDAANSSGNKEKSGAGNSPVNKATVRLDNIDRENEYLPVDTKNLKKMGKSNFLDTHVNGDHFIKSDPNINSKPYFEITKNKIGTLQTYFSPYVAEIGKDKNIENRSEDLKIPVSADFSFLKELYYHKNKSDPNSLGSNSLLDKIEIPLDTVSNTNEQSQTLLNIKPDFIIADLQIPQEPTSLEQLHTRKIEEFFDNIEKTKQPHMNPKLQDHDKGEDSDEESRECTCRSSKRKTARHDSLLLRDKTSEIRLNHPSPIYIFIGKDFGGPGSQSPFILPPRIKRTPQDSESKSDNYEPTNAFEFIDGQYVRVKHKYVEKEDGVKFRHQVHVTDYSTVGSAETDSLKQSSTYEDSSAPLEKITTEAPYTTVRSNIDPSHIEDGCQYIQTEESVSLPRGDGWRALGEEPPGRRAEDASGNLSSPGSWPEFSDILYGTSFMNHHHHHRKHHRHRWWAHATHHLEKIKTKLKPIPHQQERRTDNFVFSKQVVDDRKIPILVISERKKPVQEVQENSIQVSDQSTQPYTHRKVRHEN